MPSASTMAIVRTFLRALRTRDRDLLASIALPHPEIGTLLPPLGTPAMAADADPSLPELHAIELPGARQLIPIRVGETEHLLVVHATQFGLRVDLRHLIAARQPDDPRRATARSFYRAMLVGDVETLRQLAFDAAGVEALGRTGGPPAPRSVESVVAALSLVELGLGEAFTVASGVQFVSARHLELGIVVMAGLTPTGEIPFLLRQRETAWRVITLHFQQAAAQARVASPHGGQMVV